jgi:hypothetical protein
VLNIRKYDGFQKNQNNATKRMYGMKKFMLYQSKKPGSDPYQVKIAIDVPLILKVWNL